LDSPAAVLEAVKKGSVDAGIVWTPFASSFGVLFQVLILQSPQTILGRVIFSSMD